MLRDLYAHALATGAVAVNPAEGAKRMRAMRRHLFKNDLDHWATSFFEALRGQATGQPPIPLLYLGGNTFGAAFDPSLRLRVVVAGGRATKVVLQQGGTTVEGPRQP